jgi:hypothetical protein
MKKGLIEFAAETKKHKMTTATTNQDRSAPHRTTAHSALNRRQNLIWLPRGPCILPGRQNLALPNVCKLAWPICTDGHGYTTKEAQTDSQITPYKIAYKITHIPINTKPKPNSISPSTIHDYSNCNVSFLPS